MILDLAVVRLLLAIGNVLFRHFDPHLPLWRRLAKVALILAATAVISHFFGRAGVVVAAILAVLPVVYIHAIWLPRRGVNGWTAEPRAKYYALRGWPPPEDP